MELDRRVDRMLSGSDQPVAITLCLIVKARCSVGLDVGLESETARFVVLDVGLNVINARFCGPSRRLERAKARCCGLGRVTIRENARCCGLDVWRPVS